MLQAIRERSQGLIVAIIVGFISLTFALWGVESYISEGRQVVVAEVDDEEILLTEFQDNLQKMRSQAQSALGQAYAAIDWNSADVKRRALDQIVDDRIVTRLIDDTRMRISDLQVARQLQQIPAFQDEAGFSRMLYEQRLPQLGLTEEGFERELRKDMAKSQLRAGIAASEFVTPVEAREVERLRQQKRDIGYAIIPASTYEDQVTITDEDVRAGYEANKEAYRRDELVKLEYIELAPAALEADVKVTEEVLREYYESNTPAYTRQEQRNVNHILFQAAESADAATIEGALDKANQALTRARAGESFEDLAGELSDDVGSRTEGGETGLFLRGVMAPEFEEAAFALEIGEVSEPVRTKFGYHVIKLKEIEPGGLQPFAEVRADVERAYRAAQAQQAFFDQVEQFSNLVYEHPDSLATAADALGLEIRTTEASSREQLATLFSEQTAARAFETEVLVEGLNAEPVELADGRVVAVRVTEHKPSEIPPLAEVKDAVVDVLRTERLRALTEGAAKAMIEKLRGGATIADTVEKAGFGWATVDAIDRESDEANRAVLRAAFRTRVDGSAPTFTGVPVGQSDYAVISIANMVMPAEDEIERNEIIAVQRELLEARAALVWQDFVDALRASSNVEVFNRNL